VDSDESGEGRYHAIRAGGRGVQGGVVHGLDTFLLKALPPIPKDVPVALSPHRISAASEASFSAFNSGYLFARTVAVLDKWREFAQTSRSTRCRDQTSWEDVARTFPRHQNFSCGVNVGWYQLNAEHSREGRDVYDQIRCKNGKMMCGECEIVSMHFHVGMYSGLDAVLQPALEECNSPMASNSTTAL